MIDYIQDVSLTFLFLFSFSFRGKGAIDSSMAVLFILAVLSINDIFILYGILYQGCISEI